MGQENRLAREPSPYLQQHKHNPVDWFAWGEEAFEKARSEDKPIFLSIGYSTCHWCHVMERESFEDEEVARLMNETFVSVKVDREERPDIDGIYMTVCQMVTGQGGWPLTIVMTPDLKPFYAATYVPKQSRYGRIGMLDLIPRIGQVWQEHRGEILESAQEITSTLQQASTVRTGTEVLHAATLDEAYQQFAQRFDARHGGFGTAPKFPTPHNLLFLLRYWKRTGEVHALLMVEETLRHMRRGGIFDHVGFGFHRYSTDARWLLPHFEKMLYDQALLTMAYVETYQATKDPSYEQVAREILTYVLRDMTSPEGGFYSAEDADSEGREGKFYVWTYDELHEVLSSEDADLVVQLYNVSRSGNFEEEATREQTGENILYLNAPLDEKAESLGLDAGALRERLEQIREVLFHHRERRVHPGKDDKILTDWNGLMVAALAKAAQAFNEPAYAAAATRAADFILDTLRTPEGRLLHRYRNGTAGIQANLDDYAFLIWGLIDLYEATFNVRYLEVALELNRVVLDHFPDEASGAFFFTPDDGERLIVRQKEFYDGAVPSGNSVVFSNLLRLGRITGDTALEERAGRVAEAASAPVRHMPSGFSAFLIGLEFAVGGSKEVVVVGQRGEERTDAMLHAIRSEYAPNKVVLFRPSDEETPGVVRVAPFVQHQRAVDGRATAYVCRNYTCERPTTEPQDALELLRS